MVEAAHQLKELFADPDFSRMFILAAKEVMGRWNESYAGACQIVLSAIGEPRELACIHREWAAARLAGGSLGRVKLIVRRRALDLLRRDARRIGHSSLSVSEDVFDAEPGLPPRDGERERDPQAQLESQQVIQLVRDEVACFGAEGAVQQRQAAMLQRYALDEASYADLSVELNCSRGALRVRVYNAMVAFREHIVKCRPGLWLGDVRGAGYV
jgi:hypothetical protein